ncbi:MAG: hypothetical protein KAW12_12805 [Candidatus Aminicenantes bacterium]|nr:hypothetical protein [Candidatus Aminicenantes bacterium]
MKHDFIDKYSHLNSPLHQLDPRTKLFFIFSLIVLIISTNRLNLFVFYYTVLIFLVVLSRVPVSYYLKRALPVTPFVAMIALFMLLSPTISPGREAGTALAPAYLKVSLIVLKTYASIILLTLLTSVTRFNCLLWAMRKFKFPTIITTLARLVYIYAFFLVDELHNTQRAVKSRAPVIRMPKTKVYGNVAASILLKSIHRSQVVYYAMTARKFSGEFPEGESNRFGLADLSAAFCFVLVLLSTYILWNL